MYQTLNIVIGPNTKLEYKIKVLEENSSFINNISVAAKPKKLPNFDLKINANSQEFQNFIDKIIDTGYSP